MISPQLYSDTGYDPHRSSRNETTGHGSFDPRSSAYGGVTFSRDGGSPETTYPRVSGRGRMTAQGYEPENAAYWNDLTEVVAGRRTGKDPLSLLPGLLSAAGHGP